MFCTLTLQTDLVHFAGGKNCAVFSAVKLASDMIGGSTGGSLGSYLLHWNCCKNIFFWFSLSPQNPNTERWEDNILLKEAAVRKVPHSWQFLKDSRGRILIQKSFWQVLEESEPPWSIKKVISIYFWQYHYQETEYIRHLLCHFYPPAADLCFIDRITLMPENRVLFREALSLWGWWGGGDPVKRPRSADIQVKPPPHLLLWRGRSVLIL